MHEQALESLTPQELQVYDGHEVLDPDGESLGEVDLIFVDEETGRPEWLGLWNGIPFTHRRIVPVRGGVIRQGVTIHVPYRKAVFERAPSYHEHFLHGDPREVHISREQEAEAYRLYGIEPPPGAGGEDPRVRARVGR
jgi:hypothetical protein